MPLSQTFYTVVINVHNHKSNLHHTPTHQPCLCLCLGFALQKTNRWPLRLTKKQSLQRLLKDDLVFIPADGWMQARCWHCPKSDGPWWWPEEPGKGAWLEMTVVDECNGVRWVNVRVQRRLKALVTGDDRIRFSRLTWTTWWVRLEAMRLRSSGAMMAKAGGKQCKSISKQHHSNIDINMEFCLKNCLISVNAREVKKRIPSKQIIFRLFTYWLARGSRFTRQ